MKWLYLIWVSLVPQDVHNEHETALWLARSAVGEAGWRAHTRDEDLAIWHVYRKRHGIHRRPRFMDTVIAYSSPVNPKRTRRPWIREIPLDLEGWKGQHFRYMYDRAIGFLRGETYDPCPRAWHFGAPTDRPQGKMQRVSCNVRTKNYFYKPVR